MAPAIPWLQMTNREQLVWAATYASRVADPTSAVRLANRAVQQLKELDLDNKRYQGPEYEAARYGPGLTIEEFRAWYPVALKLATMRAASANEVTDQACQEAYEIYRRCCTEFY